jgi:lipopolysaccharide/colanic/teichoic acid biosynthesis glycosyltransferase
MVTSPIESSIQHTEQVGANMRQTNVATSIDMSAWTSLLEALPHIRIGRLLYCLFLKRWFDFMFAAVALILLSPLFILVIIALRLEMPYPAIFRQKRIGLNGQPFTIFKFRTMIADRRQSDCPLNEPDRRKRHKTPNDPRVTRVGKLLRLTSIDELPQLINILRGEMSFIGPRPELVNIVDRYAAWQHKRHIVRPGLSGWWQIHGRSELPMHEHTELDIYYVENMSFRLDLLILLKTVRIVLFHSGAFGWASIALPLTLFFGSFLTAV